VALVSAACLLLILQSERTIDTARRYIPDAAAVNNLLGRLLLGMSDVKRAAEYFNEALKLNPFMWDAFEHLCNTGRVVPWVQVTKLIKVFRRRNPHPQRLQVGHGLGCASRRIPHSHTFTTL